MLQNVISARRALPDSSPEKWRSGAVPLHDALTPGLKPGATDISGLSNKYWLVKN
jgi:hypothetical protein